MTKEQVQAMHEEETGKKSTWCIGGQIRYTKSYSEWLQNRVLILMGVNY